MSRYCYDFHIHSCLSPCADNDMTPNNIAGMLSLAGIRLAALTDHNSCKNCPAFFSAAERNGVVPIAGMELTTAEDIHIVCLFEKLDDAMSFDSQVDGYRILVKNRIDIFGEQLILDENDEIVGTEVNLLPNATTLTIERADELVREFGGVCYPAHVDREANGILATLGDLPPKPPFKCAEFADKSKKDAYLMKYPALREKLLLTSSDAHQLWEIRDGESFFEFADGPYSDDLVRKNLFQRLR